VIKPTRCTNFTNLFCHETLHVSDRSSVHHQEFIHCTLSNGICIPSWSCSKAVYKPVWHIPLLRVQWINSCRWTDGLSKTCTVSWQNKFVKLVHLVGFIIKKFVTMHSHMSRCTVTCHDAQSHVTMHSHMNVKWYRICFFKCCLPVLAKNVDCSQLTLAVFRLWLCLAFCSPHRSNNTAPMWTSNPKTSRDCTLLCSGMW